MTDELTGLADRDELDSAWDRLEDPACLLVDLDKMKEVNDTYGHDVGDAMLCCVAERMSGAVREDDVVARIGGDEFVVLVGDPESAESIAHRLRDVIGEPMDAAGTRLVTHGSIGVATPTPGDDLDSIMKRADQAMYRAKEQSGGAMACFDQSMRDRLEREQTLKADLEEAFTNSQFRMDLRPVMDLVPTGKPRFSGVQARVVWNHPDFGILQPDEYRPIIRECGRATRLDRAILRRLGSAIGSVQAAVEERSSGDSIWGSMRCFRSSVSHADISGDVESILGEMNLDPDRLVLTFQESEKLVGNDQVHETLSRLRSMGIHVGLHNFGTGFSSLVTLSDWPINHLVLDRTIIESNDRNLVRSVVDLAGHLNMNLIVQGVSDPQDVNWLTSMRAGYAVGARFQEYQPFNLFMKTLRTTDLSR